MSKFYLSFVGNHAFLGGCFVEAKDGGNAIQEASRQGCNPGGEVMVINIDLADPENEVGLRQEHFNRLLSLEELNEIAPTSTLGELRSHRAN